MNSAPLAFVDAAVEQLVVLQFLAEHRNQLEPVEITVLQGQEVMAEQHRCGGLVAVQQRYPAGRIFLQRGANDRQHRRDAAAGGDAEVADAGPVRAGGGEPALGSCDIEPVPGAQGFVGVGAEAPAGLQLDAHLQRLARDAADGIGTPHRLAFEDAFEGEVLSRREPVLGREPAGNIQGDPHGARRFRNDAGDFETVKFHPECLQVTPVTPYQRAPG